MQLKYFTTSLEHILAELKRINLVVQMHVQRALEVYEKKGEFQGFFISKQEVEWLMKKPIGTPNWATSREHLFTTENQAKLDRMVEEIARRKSESAKQGVTLLLERLSRLFRLNPFDVDTLLICLAPEIDLRYERVYGYLQDDITRKRPSVDLVLSLLCSSLKENLTARKRFNPDSPLFRHHFLYFLDDPQHPNTTLLGQNLKIDERIVSYLLDQNTIDDRLKSFSDLTVPHIQRNDLILPEAIMNELSALILKEDLNNDCLILYLQGPYGVGKRSTAEALCHSIGKKLLIVDTEGLQKFDKFNFENMLRRIMREALLDEAVINWNHFDYMLAEERRDNLSTFLKILNAHKGFTVISGNKSWEPKGTQLNRPFISIKIPLPPYKDRLRLWENALNGNKPIGSKIDLSALSNKFRFSGGQIQDVIATAKNRFLLKPLNNSCLNMKDLYGACRAHSNRNLNELSRKINPKFSWDDIVLPESKMAQLREITDHVKYRQLVYEDWGFERKLSLGKGLSALFSGPSGTGKTMAAEIMAGELGLDLYKIDLSSVVSKYIGETEKNLSRIFTEAETSNAILFFDEADALFGKRSEVKDAHDRYANIEIGYLLQRMEEYDGITILATNLRKNIDDAFVRRMKFILEFPFPDETHRYQIWQVHFPDEAPQGDDIDFKYLASNFKLTGGNIRNIVLHAAFLSASEKRAIGMNYMIRGIQREFQKIGKVCVKGEFGKYFEIVERNDNR